MCKLLENDIPSCLSLDPAMPLSVVGGAVNNTLFFFFFHIIQVVLRSPSLGDRIRRYV